MFKRPCPHVGVYAGNEGAVEIMSYVRAGGWLEQVGSVMLTQLLRQDSDAGAQLVRRISTALSSKEYREAMDATKPTKPKPPRK